MSEHPTSSSDTPDDIAAIGSLAEPSRRRLYEYVVSADDWVGRDRAADATGIRRSVAAHHLDRMADEGLLEVDYQRLTGRSGPGAGRPAKVYRRAPTDFGVTLPPRSYGFAGRILAEAVDDARSEGTDVSDAVRSAACSEGRQLGEVIRERLDSMDSPTAGGDSARDVVLEVLTEHGYEPFEKPDGTVVLRNCPFHDLAQAHTELICGMNHQLISSALDGLGPVGLDAHLEPEPGVCCVRLRPDTHGA